QERSKTQTLFNKSRITNDTCQLKIGKQFLKGKIILTIIYSYVLDYRSPNKLMFITAYLCIGYTPNTHLAFSRYSTFISVASLIVYVAFSLTGNLISSPFSATKTNLQVNLFLISTLKFSEIKQIFSFFCKSLLIAFLFLK